MLATIAIIGLLVGLLIPAVQSAREAARRSSCGNNLRQIGTALQSFINANNGVLPAGEMAPWGTNTSGSSVTFDHGSVTMYLLPFLEQQALYAGYDMVEPRWTATTFPPTPNADKNPTGNSWAKIPGTSTFIAHVTIPTYLCPSDTILPLAQSINQVYAGTDYPGRKKLNYIGCWGAQEIPWTGTPLRGLSCSSPCNSATVSGFGSSATTNQKRSTGSIRQPGVFSQFQSTQRHYATYPSMDVGRCKVAEILDGMSNTIAFGETRPSCSWQLYVMGWGAAGNTAARGTTNVPINYNTCDQGPLNDGVPNENKPFNDNPLSYGFKSAHPGGAAFLFCDGRVTFLPETIDVPTYQRLGAKADGEILDDY